MDDKQIDWLIFQYIDRFHDRQKVKMQEDLQYQIIDFNTYDQR